MSFSVISSLSKIPSHAKGRAFLITDNWDDWFEFQTLFHLVYCDDSGNRHDIGSVKIGQFGMKKDQRSPEIPTKFDALDDSFFSLGQDDSYYTALNELGDTVRDHLLASLNDLAANAALFENAVNERVVKISLLRSVKPASVRGQFRRLALGGARLSEFNFSYRAPRRIGSDTPPIEINFAVEPESHPPTNIHVLIGRNGVGKTYLLNNMTRALLDTQSARSHGSFSSGKDSSNLGLFANLVSVTFSAFDPFEPLPERRDQTAGMMYSYVGLKRASNTGAGVGTAKTPPMLASEFVRSLRNCLQGAKMGRWRHALQILSADPIFQDASIDELISIEDDEFEKQATSKFSRLSSGHKIVLLTITRLIETVEERTLVLIDEPEAHLHPPLLSAFVRALSDLLIDRNGVAVIATHSPVVLQEVPRNCVWKLRRTGLETSAERPEIETFGENVGVLTREVFGLEVTRAGFHTLISDAVEQHRHLEFVLAHFKNELGAEARAIAQALIADANEN